WDFSWESSIGVDRFWSPPHLATHIAVWLNGLLGLRLLFRFSLSQRQDASGAGARVGPLSAPSGAWVLIWGAALMQAAFLLDNWWQKSYGLGAGLWAPPQLLKTVGFSAILFGGVLLCAAKAGSISERPLGATLLRLWYGGLLLAMAALVLSISNLPNKQHTAFFFLISVAIYPAILIGVGHA